LGLTVIVVLVVVLLGLAGSIGSSQGRVLTSRGDVVTLQDPEPVNASRVLYSNGLAVLVDVAVLSDPLVVSSSLQRLIPLTHPTENGSQIVLCCGPCVWRKSCSSVQWRLQPG
jgi:hypothetical protein